MSDAFMAPGAYDAEAEQIRRRMAYAQALQQQGQQPLQGRMAGNMYVKPHWLEGMAQMLKSYEGARAMDGASADYAKLGEQRRNDQTADLQGVMELLRGRPAMPEQQGPQAEGGSPELAAQPAVPGDPNAALVRAMSSRFPVVQGLGASLAAQAIRVPKWESSKIPDGKGGERVGFVDINSSDPMATFREGGVQPPKRDFVNGQAVNPYDTLPGTVIPKQPDAPNLGQDLVIPDGKGGVRPNTPLINAKTTVATAGASRVNLNTEKTYAGALADGVAKSDIATLDAAKGAPSAISTAHNILRLLDGTPKPITGSFAERRLAIEKGLATVGLIDGQTVKSTEDLVSMLNTATLEAIKTSGLGAGQGFTDNDLKFLQAAKSGNIEINADTLRRSAELQEKVARLAITQSAKINKRLRADPTMGSVANAFPDIEQPAPYISSGAVDDALRQYPGGAR